MSNISIHPKLNPLEVLLVEEHMTKFSPKVTHYTMTEGNDCIWVYYGQINKYYIFRGGKLVDIQID
jgi:hypothetical protein